MRLLNLFPLTLLLIGCDSNSVKSNSHTNEWRGIIEATETTPVQNFAFYYGESTNTMTITNRPFLYLNSVPLVKFTDGEWEWLMKHYNFTTNVSTGYVTFQPAWVYLTNLWVLTNN
jgi:hypothetical protein